MNLRSIILFIAVCAISTSCGVYSTLNFENNTKEIVYINYVQENGTVFHHEVNSKENLTMMFDKKWTDKNIRNVVNNIKELTIYTDADTLLYLRNKEKLYNLFKDHRSNPFKDRVLLKIK